MISDSAWARGISAPCPMRSRQTHLVQAKLQRPCPAGDSVPADTTTMTRRAPDCYGQRTCCMQNPSRSNERHITTISTASTVIGQLSFVNSFTHCACRSSGHGLALPPSWFISVDSYTVRELRHMNLNFVITMFIFHTLVPKYRTFW